MWMIWWFNLQVLNRWIDSVHQRAEIHGVLKNYPQKGSKLMLVKGCWVVSAESASPKKLWDLNLSEIFASFFGGTPVGQKGNFWPPIPGHVKLSQMVNKSGPFMILLWNCRGLSVKTGWWFHIFFMFTPTWRNDLIWTRGNFSNGLGSPTIWYKVWKSSRVYVPHRSLLPWSTPRIFFCFWQSFWWGEVREQKMEAGLRRHIRNIYIYF